MNRNHAFQVGYLSLYSFSRLIWHPCIEKHIKIVALGDLLSCIFYCRDPEVFPDPEKFDPTRFLDEHGKFHRADHVVSYGIGKWISSGYAFQLAHIMIRFCCRF